MIVSFDFWGEYYSNVFSTQNPIKKVNQVNLKHGTFNEVNLSNEIIDPTNILSYSHTQINWNDNNVFLAKFENNMIAGNVGVKDKNVTHIKILKRKDENETWEIYKILDFDSLIMYYSFVDKFAEAEEFYQYKIIPMNTNFDVNNVTDEGEVIFTDGKESIPQEFYVKYDHAHIFDKEYDYHLIFNLELGDMSHHMESSIIETLGNRYSYVVYHGNLDYITGSINCLLVADGSGAINRYSEKILRQEIEKFLCNKKPKGLRISDGRYMVINIVNEVQLIPDNNLRGIYNVTFEYVEIGKLSNIGTIIDCDLMNDYRIFNAEYENIISQ